MEGGFGERFSEFITNESMKCISKKNFKYNVNVYNSPWNLRLKLIKMLEGFSGIWDMFIFHLEWVCISVWHLFLPKYLSIHQQQGHSNFFLTEVYVDFQFVGKSQSLKPIAKANNAGYF